MFLIIHICVAYPCPTEIVTWILFFDSPRGQCIYKNMHKHMMNITIKHDQAYVCPCVCKRYKKTERKRNNTDKREQRDEDRKRQRARKEYSGRTRQEKRDEYEERERDDENREKTSRHQRRTTTTQTCSCSDTSVRSARPNNDNQLFRGLFCLCTYTLRQRNEEEKQVRLWVRV